MDIRDQLRVGHAVTPREPLREVVPDVVGFMLAYVIGFFALGLAFDWLWGFREEPPWPYNAILWMVVCAPLAAVTVLARVMTVPDRVHLPRLYGGSVVIILTTFALVLGVSSSVDEAYGSDWPIAALAIVEIVAGGAIAWLFRRAAVACTHVEPLA